MEFKSILVSMHLMLILPTNGEKIQKANTALPLAQSGDHQVMFYETGTYAGDVAWNHISIPIDGNKIILDLTEKINYLQSYVQKLELHGHQIYGEVNKEIVANGRRRLEENLEEIIDLFTAGLAPKRVKRFLGLLVFGIATLMFSVLGNAANMIALSHMGDKLTNIEKVQNNILELEDVHDGALHKLDIQLQNITAMFQDDLKYSPAVVQSSMERFVFQGQYMTEQLIETFQALQDHRLSHTLLEFEVLQKLFQVVVDNATTKGYEALIKRPSDLFQVETSYILMPNYKIVLVVHVPMVKQGHLLRLYQNIPIPLSQNFLQNSSITPVVGDRDIIAVGVIDGKRHYKTLGQSDLLKCLKIGDTNVCDGRTILQTNFEDTCLSSLWTQNLQGLLAKCDFEVAEKREEVYALSNDEFIVTSENALYTKVECKDFTHSIHVGPISKVKIEHGCSVPLKHHVLIPNPEFVHNVDIINYAWTWNIQDLFQEIDSNTANELVSSLKEYGHHVMTVKDLQKWNMDNYDAPLLSRHSNTYVVVGLLCLAGSFALTVGLIWCLNYCNSDADSSSHHPQVFELQHFTPGTNYFPNAPRAM